MSEQKLVSPLLDGFQMGDPISSHDGVRCCPAIKENSDNKYIVKILSIPAAQSQLDALLLTGAFQDAAGALAYFKDLADGVVREAQLHQQLSRLDGFVPCEAWQVVPMEDNQLGYDVYLLTPYRRTLERYLKQNAMTHLGAVNLGLDICAALAVCRHASHIYVDLKPSNIFMSDDREYRIGDLGFISMDSMKYAALPTKYRSSYTAPEMHDVFATISDTADIYALGLILYQVYNDGVLPFDELPPAEEFAPPANADYEMAEIILKACHPDPTQRWQNPTEMGQALVAYMQRNTINDVPIIPPVIPEPEEEAAAEALPTEEAEEEAVPETVTAGEEQPAEEAPVEEASEEVPTEETTEETEAVEAPAEETEAAEEPAEETEAAEEEEAPAPTEVELPVDEELAEVLEVIADETLPDEEDAAELDADLISEETSAMLAQAEELAAHEIPEPVVVHVPEEEPEAKPEPEAPEAEPETAEAEDDEDDGGEDEVDIPIAIPDLEPVKKKSKKWLVAIVVLLLLAGLGYGAHYYYQNYYLIPVESIILDGEADRIIAQVDVDIDESVLTAICTDTYGNTATSKVENGQATFTGLKPGTQYTVSLKAEGFCQLTGNNAASFTTTRQTNIVSLSATTGAEDGSVILSFTIDGSDPENWTVEYGTEGEDPQTIAFTGHMVTIPGLTVGSPYTFRLMPTEQSDVEVVGTDTLEFTVSPVVLAENVAIASIQDGLMTITWNAPADIQVDEWTIRCTDGGEYDQTLTVTDCTAQFSGAQIGTTYSLEILASGMTQSVRTDVTPQLLTVTTVSCTPVGGTALRITWEYEGEAPAGGWTVSYSINGGEARQLTSDTNAADLSPLIPGAVYSVSVSGVEASYEAPAAPRFTGHGISASDLQYSTCLTPSVSGWTYGDVTKYTSSFSAGQSVSMVVYSQAKLNPDDANTQILYVIRDAQGNLLPELAAIQTMNWKDMWKDRYFYPTVPNVPAEAGTYTVEIYFDGELAISKRITIE